MRRRVLLVEAGLVVGAFLLAWTYLSGRNGYPISTDDVFYLHVAFNTAQWPHILNRYGHIYALKLFVALSNGDPFRAANLYWGLLMSASITSTYVGTRLLTSSRYAVSIVAGVLAVLFFVSQPFLVENAAVPFADYSAVLMIVLATVLYLLIQRSARFRVPLLVVLGLIFFFALKTKEHSIVIGVLLLGLGFEANGRYRVARLFRNTLPLLAGMAAGQIVFMILDQAFLGDALFGLRPENWQRVLTYNLEGDFPRIPGSYLQTIAGSEALVLSVLALLAATGWETRTRPESKVLWLLPIAYISFLTFSLMSAALKGVVPRYIVIIVPILSILAACYFYAILSRSSPSIRWLIAGLIVGWILAQGIILPWAETHQQWERTAFRLSVLMPLAVIGAGLLAVTAPSQAKLVILGWSLCVGLILMPPTVQVFQDLNTGSTRAQRSIERWTPHQVFRSIIQPSHDMLLLTSQSLFQEYGYAGPAASADVLMFNLYFRTNLSRSQFRQGNTTPATISELQPTYVLMTVNDWHKWEDSERLAVFAEAQVFTESTQRLILVNFGPRAPEVQEGVPWFPLSVGSRNCLMVAKEAEPGVYEFQCYAQEGADYTILGWTYQAGDGSIGTSVAEGSPVTGDQLKQMAYSFGLFSGANIETESS